MSCDGPSDPDPPSSCKNTGSMAGIALSGICPHVFSPNTTCTPSKAESASDCCSSVSPIPCAGHSCPASGWTYDKHTKLCTVFTRLTNTTGALQTGAVSGVVPAMDPGGSGCGGGLMDQAFGFLLVSPNSCFDHTQRVLVYILLITCNLQKRANTILSSSIVGHVLCVICCYVMCGTEEEARADSF